MSELLNLAAPLTTNDIQRLQPALATLQGNILKGHGRSHADHIFLEFASGRLADVRSWLRRFIPNITSAVDQISTGGIRDTGPFVSLSLTAQGHGYFQGRLGPEFDTAYVVGMKAQRSILGDPEKTEWEDLHRGPIHAMVLLAHDDENLLTTLRNRLLEDLGQAVQSSFFERGTVLRDAANVSYEHFGYVDGISQPIFFADGVIEKQPGGVNDWNPGAAPRNVLTRDPLCPAGGDGSYLVFRKLEQRVAAFWNFRRQLSQALQISEDRAGALAIGRDEAGMPLVGATAPPGTPPHQINNFNYNNDLEGLRCPLHAHIRKMNPRGSASGIDTMRHRIVRRGIPYGPPLDPKADLAAVEAKGEDTGRGLLFMCYQSKISVGFEVLQGQWANEEEFPALGAGPDSVVGQPGRATSITWRVQQPNVHSITLPFSNFVKLMGGVYFFTPSKLCLERLSKGA